MNDIGFLKATDGTIAIVDSWLMPFLTQFKWSASKHFKYKYFRTYKCRNGKSKCFFLHRIVNCTPRNLETDHINGNALDIRACNLRNATKTQNSQNRNNSTKLNKSSRFKGVLWDKRWKKWRAGIRINKRSINLGSFTNEIEAARAYNEKAKELFEEFASLNIVDEQENKT